MVDGPKKEVELAQLHFEQRKSEWLLYRVFKHRNMQDTVAARFDCLKRIMQWRNWCEGHGAVMPLVETWQAEDRWEQMIREHFEEDDWFPSSDDEPGYDEHHMHLHVCYFN